MIDEILQKRPKKHVQDLNIVPILDMLTTVIFFLLMSTSFIEYTKLTLPPASTVEAAPSKNNAPPLAPKAWVTRKEGKIWVRLMWAGERPGQTSAEAEESTLTAEARALAESFSKQYPSEKTLQVSMARDVNYQSLISLMDGVKDFLPDVVLVSYSEAESR